MATRVIVSGCISGAALGYAGNTWAMLQYVLGFRRLGCETYYVEALAANDCVDDEWNAVDFAASVNARYFRTLIDRFGLTGHAALLEQDGPGHVGLRRAEVDRLAAGSDVLINLSGHLRLASVLEGARRRVYVDLDPGYTQIWRERYGVDMNLGGHDVYVSVGLNIGQADCPLPTLGIDWKGTLPPVVMSEWTTQARPGVTYSTVADWRGFGEVEWEGIRYGQKRDEFLKVVELPGRVAVPLELCLFIHPDEPDRRTLETHGWRLASPRVHAATPDAYRRYIQGARAEFTCVKSGYAAGRTAWFSDRSACYLAAGRPVITQDTGIGRYLPTGDGLLTFSDIGGAAAAIEHVERDYAHHAAAARDVARRHLDSDRVLPQLLEMAKV